MHLISFGIVMIYACFVCALPSQDNYFDYYGQPQGQQQYDEQYNQPQGQDQYNQQQGQQRQGYSGPQQTQEETTKTHYNYRCQGANSLPYCCYRDENQQAQCATYGGFCTSNTIEMCCPGDPSSTLSCAEYFTLFELSQFQDQRFLPG